MNVHVVREAFGLDGIDYPRGSEISDPEILKRVRESHPTHLVQTHVEAPKKSAPAPSAAPAPEKTVA